MRILLLALASLSEPAVLVLLSLLLFGGARAARPRSTARPSPRRGAPAAPAWRAVRRGGAHARKPSAA